MAAAADRGGKRDYRVGLVSLRHRGEPADDRRPAPVYPRARADRPPRQTGGTVRAEHAARHSAERGPAGVNGILAEFTRPSANHASEFDIEKAGIGTKKIEEENDDQIGRAHV